MDNPEPHLTLDAVTKKFGGVVACEDISIQFPSNKIAGLIGPNGAGKTTLFNLITGVYKVSSGSIQLDGVDIKNLKPNQIVELGITRTFQNNRLFKNLSLMENVLIAIDKHSSRLGLPSYLVSTKAVRVLEQESKDAAVEYLRLVGLAEHKDKRADSLPYGLQRRLEIARALALQPRILLLDEPAAGMNPEESRVLAELIYEIQQRFNLTVLLIEHHMDLVMELCEYIYVMNFGRLIAEGTPAEVQTNQLVLEAYLGKKDYASN